MTIDLNITMLFQLAFFVASYWVMKTMLFPPVLTLIKRRELMIAKANEELRRRDAEGKQMREDYNRKMRDARIQAQEIHNKNRQVSAEREREILEAARKKAAQYLYEGEVKLEEQRTQARKELDEKADELSNQIVEKILGRPISS
ncbi:MAG TPA: hypothetical protein DCE42_29380 [Myxococcales bacterium]|nr:hypothetical protein [Deltaproteobacteria bacterium]HAA58905.1 hypothetical protein [Myxococcales bacterium]|tara:strand:- start:5441 stop:5875 length:435 start_codon:yes stop_codon:yes gene_type:complete